MDFDSIEWPKRIDGNKLIETQQFDAFMNIAADLDISMDDAIKLLGTFYAVILFNAKDWARQQHETRVPPPQAHGLFNGLMNVLCNLSVIEYEDGNRMIDEYAKILGLKGGFKEQISKNMFNRMMGETNGQNRT